MGRIFWTKLHRWFGLFTAIFLFIAGITGSILCFYPEIQLALNPSWERVNPDQSNLNAQMIADKVKSIDPSLKIQTIDFRGMDEVASVRLAPPRHGNGHSHSGGHDMKFNRLILDPNSGEIIDKVKNGDLSGGLPRLGEFLLDLHYNLGFKNIGMIFMGIVAIVWFFDCFISFYLTLPKFFVASKTNSNEEEMKSKGFMARWKPSWLLRLGQGNYKFNFDLHRASGLWLWGILLVFAWSSFQFNFHRDLYPAVMKTISKYETPDDFLPKLQRPIATPKINWGQAQALGNQYANQELAKIGVNFKAPVRLFYNARNGAYYYAITTSKDIEDRPRHRTTMLYIDGQTGALLKFARPTGRNWGNTFATWTAALHSGVIFGWPYRIFVLLVGLVTGALSITGIYIWWKKWLSRHKAEIRHTGKETKLSPSAAE